MKILQVGAGGTGSEFLHHYVRISAGLESVPDLTMVDADIVEEKNLGRQVFSKSDVGNYKVRALAKAVQGAGYRGKVTVFPEYILSSPDLRRISGYDRTETYILLGCVDNHRARQSMHEFFYMLDNCIYIDAANEFASGELVVGIRLMGRDIAPPRGYYYKEVLSDISPRVSELGCGAVNFSSPQHHFTNDAMGNKLARVVYAFLKKGYIVGGVLSVVVLEDEYVTREYFRPFKVPEGLECPGKEEVYGNIGKPIF